MKLWWFLPVLLMVPICLQAQQKKIERKGEFYFSWGYNKEWYTRSDVQLDQPSLNSKYTLKSVQSHDHIGWDEGLFSIPISIPQYNYRFGYFFNKKKASALASFYIYLLYTTTRYFLLLFITVLLP